MGDQWNCDRPRCFRHELWVRVRVRVIYWSLHSVIKHCLGRANMHTWTTTYIQNNTDTKTWIHIGLGTIQEQHGADTNSYKKRITIKKWLEHVQR